MTTGVVAWLTGLSGAGKSTIAELAVTELTHRGLKSVVIDGDAVRAADKETLGFSRRDIEKNNFRIAEKCREARLVNDIVLVPVIAPFEEVRARLRTGIEEPFIVVYVKASLSEVMRRDPKGLYRRALAGHLPGMIGFDPSAAYEPPSDPDLLLDTQAHAPEKCAQRLVDALIARRERR